MTATVPLRYSVSSTTYSAFKSKVPSNNEPLLGRIDNVTVIMKNKDKVEYKAQYPFLTIYDPETKNCQKDLIFKKWYLSLICSQNSLPKEIQIPNVVFVQFLLYQNNRTFYEFM